MLRTAFFTLLLSALFVPFSAAQRHGGGRTGWGHPGMIGARGIRLAARPRSVENRGFFLGEPFFYADYPFESPVTESPDTQIVMVQPPAVGETAPEPKTEPLLIELQGGRYVRYGGSVQTSQGGLRVEDGPSQPAVSSRTTSHEREAAKRELAPAVLVYGDGYREEVRDYVIADGNLYARGEYWRDGYWNKNIRLSALDVPATIKANQAKGIQFVLPSSPNEVVTRP